jgi:hypothetical protein
MPAFKKATILLDAQRRQLHAVVGRRPRDVFQAEMFLWYHVLYVLLDIAPDVSRDLICLFHKL